MNEYGCKTCKDTDCHYHPEYADEDMGLDERLRYHFIHLFSNQNGVCCHSEFKNQREKVMEFHKLLVERSQLELIEEQKEFTDGIRSVLFEFEEKFPELRQSKDGE